MKRNENSPLRPTSRSLSRRQAVCGVGALAIAMPYLTRRAAAAEVLYINTWGGIWQEAAVKNLFQPFTSKTGIEIRTISPVSVAKLAAQAQSKTYDFDMTTLNGTEISQADSAGLIEPLNLKIVSDKRPPGSLFRNGVASHAFSTNLVFNLKHLQPGQLKSWRDFGNLETFTGPRCLPRMADEHIPLALLADGVPKESVYPPDVERAYRTLDKLKPKIPAFWGASAQAQQLISDGEVHAIGMWHSTALNAKRAGAQIELVWNEAKVNRAYWAVCKGTPRAELAWRFIEFATGPENLAGFCKMAGYGPLYPEAFNYIEKEAMVNMPTSAENYKLAFEDDPASIGPLMTDLTRRFNGWVTK